MKRFFVSDPHAFALGGWLILIFLILGSGVLLAQKKEKCGEQELFAARKLYERGHFQETVDSLKKCQKNGFKEKTHRIQAHRLLALSYIALDYPELAKAEVFAMVKLDRLYRPPDSDPEVFKKLVREERKNYRKSGGSFLRNWRFIAVSGAVLTAGTVLGVSALSSGDKGTPVLPDPPALP